MREMNMINQFEDFSNLHSKL